MRTFESSSFTVQVPDRVVFIQERQYLVGTLASAEDWEAYTLTIRDPQGGVIGDYHFDTDGVAYVELTDILTVMLGLYPDLQLSISVGSSSVVVGFVFGGLISPLHISAPKASCTDDIAKAEWDTAWIITPVTPFNDLSGCEGRMMPMPSKVIRWTDVPEYKGEEGLVLFGTGLRVFSLLTTTDGNFSFVVEKEARWRVDITFTTTSTETEKQLNARLYALVQTIYNDFNIRATPNINGIDALANALEDGFWKIRISPRALESLDYSKTYAALLRLRELVAAEDFPNVDYLVDEVNLNTYAGWTTPTFETYWGQYYVSDGSLWSECGGCYWIPVTPDFLGVQIREVIQELIPNRRYRQDPVQTIRFEDPGCSEVAVVEWQPITGMGWAQTVTKKTYDFAFLQIENGSKKPLLARYMWFVRDRRVMNTEQINLENVVAEFDYIKNRVEEMTLYLDGLTAYDVWYYGQIIASSDVRVNGREVDVLSKDVAIPDGDAGGLYELRVRVRTRVYKTQKT